MSPLLSLISRTRAASSSGVQSLVRHSLALAVCGGGVIICQPNSLNNKYVHEYSSLKRQTHGCMHTCGGCVSYVSL